MGAVMSYDPTLPARLDAAVRAAAPAVAGVRIGDVADRSTWGVTWPSGYDPSQDERRAARQAIAAFDATPPPPRKTRADRIAEALVAKGIFQEGEV